MTVNQKVRYLLNDWSLRLQRDGHTSPVGEVTLIRKFLRDLNSLQFGADELHPSVDELEQERLR